jgi:hypothetical protein
MKASIPVDCLRKILAYDDQMAVLRWRVPVSRRFKAGDIAGCARKDGRYVVRVRGSLYYQHRVVWALVHGAWPSGEIDHINGDESDNRIENLRDVSSTVNQQNKRKAFKKSKTGLLGASPAGCPGEIGRYVAFIGGPDGRKNLGYFDTPEEAHAAYVAAKRKIHAGCTI